MINIPAHTMDSRQLATVLAALRYWQREGLLNSGAECEIAADCGEIEPLSSMEIDHLCELLNR